MSERKLSYVANKWEAFGDKIWGFIRDARGSGSGPDITIASQTEPLQKHWYDIKRCLRYQEDRSKLPDRINSFDKCLPVMLNLRFSDFRLPQWRAILMEWYEHRSGLVTICPRLGIEKRILNLSPVDKNDTGFNSVSYPSSISNATGGVGSGNQSFHVRTASADQSFLSAESRALVKAHTFDNVKEIEWYTNMWLSIMVNVAALLSLLGLQVIEGTDRPRTLLVKLHAQVKGLYECMAQSAGDRPWSHMTESVHQSVNQIDALLHGLQDNKIENQWKKICEAWLATRRGYASRFDEHRPTLDERSLYPSSNVRTGSQPPPKLQILRGRIALSRVI